MSDSTTNLDTISPSQAQKEVTANALFDAISPSSLFGRRASTTSGLTWGYYGGVVNISGVLEKIPNGTIALTNGATNYLEFDASGSPTGIVKNISGFSGGTSIPLYSVVVSGGSVSSYQDWRRGGVDAGAGGTVSAADVSITDAGGYYAGSSVEAALQEIGLQAFDATTFYPGIPTASAILLRVPVARAVTFADDFAGSYGRASANATASTAFDVQKNGSSVGTITYGAGSSTATFVTAGGAVSLAAGDTLSIIAPASPDATLTNIGIVLAGTRFI